MHLWQELLNLEAQGCRAALCTVVETSGSTPRKVGAKMLVVDNGEPHGRIVGSIGGGAIEHHIRLIAVELIHNNSSKLIKTSLKNELAMCCGGEMSVFIEPQILKRNFVCFGAGHIAQSLCPLMVNIGFDVTIVDGRSDLLRLEAFAQAKRRINDSSIFALKDLGLTERSFVLVATHDHKLDQEIIEGVLAYPTQYLALVGSMRKKLFTEKRLLAKNFSLSEAQRVICPAGLKIKAQTPNEIAIAIAAQIIQVLNHEAMPFDRRGRTKPAHGVSQGADAHPR